MNGVHDLGGLQSFGPVRPEPDEPAFHDDWERRTLGMTLAMGALGLWNIDQMRHLRESLPPAQYLSSSYYEIWQQALEDAVGTLGLLDDPPEGVHARSAEELLATVSARGSYERPTSTGPRYAVGQRVRARDLNPVGHTRLPRYARGRVGTVVAVRGAHVFPDRNAVPLGQRPDTAPEWLYTVDLSGRELWGEDADPTLTVSVDAWEPYLEEAP
ncbi:nitrile hydratase subunit beta [Ornithinimicrobium pekingense]|uniref:Nitrile hydratase subunit beta n=1 Tax=Ornithinimicrobium pekingense TaxID=384677 RepID=A0ABQ2F4L5_9MICO|nr:nitrile hydratase subunit beta [Ornithinimicrobium pekingense]GGK60044.1 low-molecular weight cobalt-containing nitrile hydratase subunit beta [Ornithinimicrobium pekingense]